MKFRIAVGLILVLVLFLLGCQASHSSETDTPVPIPPQPTPTQSLPPFSPPEEQANEQAEEQVRVIEIEAYQFGWVPEAITVKQGETVRLVIRSTSEVNPDWPGHGFALDEYNISQILPEGETTVVEFVADKAGEFTFYCSVYCGKGHLEMPGILRVE